MNPLGRDAAYHAPANVLFPEAYEASKKQILKDFAMFGTMIVWTIVLVAYLGVRG